MEGICSAHSILLGVDLEGSGNKDGIRLSGGAVSLRIHIGSPEVRQPFFSPRTSRKAWLTKANLLPCMEIWSNPDSCFSYLG